VEAICPCSVIACCLRRILKREGLQGAACSVWLHDVYERLRPSGLNAAGQHLTDREHLAFRLAWLLRGR